MGERRNYQRMLDETIGRITAEGRVPKLFLHSCCGPCSSYVIEYLSDFFSITVFYYNPNMDTAEEFMKRAKEQQAFIRAFPAKHPVSYMEGAYEPKRFYEAAKGLEDEPERGARCEKCFRLRLLETARAAKDAGADYFTTTLSISPLKDAGLLNEIGEELGAELGVAWLFSDFKKKNGFLRSTQLSKEYGMYRQDYCGCVFSKRERERQKKEEKMR